MNHLNIIIEGADGCGKSTIIRALKNKHPKILTNEFDFVSLKRQLGLVEARKKIQKMYLELSASSHGHIVFDRHIISNYVYSKFDGSATISAEFLLDFEKIKNNSIIIVLRTKNNILRDRLADHDHKIDINKNLKIQEYYLSIASILKDANYKIFVRSSNGEEDTKKIVELIEEYIFKSADLPRV